MCEWPVLISGLRTPQLKNCPYSCQAFAYCTPLSRFGSSHALTIALYSTLPIRRERISLRIHPQGWRLALAYHALERPKLGLATASLLGAGLSRLSENGNMRTQFMLQLRT